MVTLDSEISTPYKVEKEEKTNPTIRYVFYV